MRAAFARIRLVAFVTLVIVFSVMERWVLVAVVGACLVFVLLRASLRARPTSQGPALTARALASPAAIPDARDLDTSQLDADADGLSDAPEFDLSSATASALRGRGGNLYIWADGAGLLRARTTPPDELIVYNQFLSHGCSIHIDREIAPALRWGIAWRRLPWPHFIAVSNPVRTSIIDAIFNGW